MDRLRMLYASELGTSRPLSKQFQLLRMGDPVEVVYEQQPDRLHPITPKEFNRLTVVVQDERPLSTRIGCIRLWWSANGMS